MGSEQKQRLTNGGGASSSNPLLAAPGHRSLKKAHLGGVIFGCNNSTMQECLLQKLFGLPGQHFLYVKNIDPGLPLFLFNYSDRSLHGIFEAASSGQMNIDPYGWTINGADRTTYPAQVQIRVRLCCQPLLETQFQPIIADNYYSHRHFWFELDHAQTDKLLSLFSSKTIAPSSFLPNAAKWRKDTQSLPPSRCSVAGGYPTSDKDAFKDVEKDDKETIYLKLQKLTCNGDKSNSFSSTHCPDASMQKLQNDDSTEHASKVQRENNIEHLPPSDIQSIVFQLMGEIEELRGFRDYQIQKTGELHQKLIVSETEIQRLKDRCSKLESLCRHSEKCTDFATSGSLGEQQLDLEDVIFLVGGYDGESWLSSMDLLSPSKDIIWSKKPLSTVRSSTSVASLNGHLYVIGGGNGPMWLDTVESYNVVNDEWTSHPSLKEKKGSLAAATLGDKIFAIGGGNGLECFSDVEMFDPDVGKWIPSRSMHQKRFALAAAELNNVLYVAGGYNGKDYLRSAERFDPREHSWTKIESMNSKRGCHSLVVLQEKLYALGGFDGTTMVPSVEVFDPRNGKWTIEDPMSFPRGYAAAAVLKDSIYVIGGVREDENMLDTVEQYEIGKGWKLSNLTAVGKRCFSSAIVL